MTIAISIKVGEGLVLAADSASSFFLEGTLAQSYHHARKLLQLEQYPVGLLTYVAVFPNPPQSTPPTAPRPSPDTRPGLGIIVGGYSRGEFFPDEFEMLLPWREPEEVWADIGGQEHFGARWWGQTAPIERLYLGCDYRGFCEWCQQMEFSEEEADAFYGQLRDRITWPIIYEGMPVQDAIDLAVYLVNVTIGHSRFAVGPPVCGGPIDVATITARGFQWIKRKRWQVKGDSVFF